MHASGLAVSMPFPKMQRMTDDATPPADDATQQVQADLAAMEAELKRFRELAARAQADVQNARQRMERESDDLRKFAAEGLLRRLLPTVDNFQRAMKQVPADVAEREWTKGIVAIEQEFLRQLAESGLARMQPLGQPVDPARHDVLMTGPGAEGMVTEVFDEGYELHGRVLRPAKVRVGDGTEE